MKKSVLATVASVSLACVMSSCVVPPPAPRTPPPPPPPAPAPVATLPVPREMITRITIGMPRVEAEAILGAPNSTQRQPPDAIEAWYLPAPPVSKPRLPKEPGAIGVTYRANKVIAKRLSPQL